MPGLIVVLFLSKWDFLDQLMTRQIGVDEDAVVSSVAKIIRVCNSAAFSIVGGHSFRHSVLPSVFISVPLQVVGTLCWQPLLQFYADSFETL